MRDTTIRFRRPLTPRLPVAAALRLARPSDQWFKPALSVVCAALAPNLTLLALGRLDLVMYTMAGSLCALYGHNLPYARRAGTVARVVLGMVTGLAVSLVTASLTDSVAVLVAVGALIAAAQKALCDAGRIGPPGNVIFTFVATAALFVPQRLTQVPGHLALTLGAGTIAWLVTAGPALLRREGPERRATARALDAAAACAADPGHRSRHTAAAAVHAARQTLLDAGRPTPVRRQLERLLLHAEATLTGGAVAEGRADADRAARMHAWAALTRARGPVPTLPQTPGGTAEAPGADAWRAARRARRRAARRTLLRSLGPRSPHMPIALRTLVGCALAGYAAVALGVDRPYWAVVTAASVFQVNVALSWNRALQRTLGNLLGVLAFAAVVPLIRTGPAALLGCLLFFSFGAEALITRNYWLGSVAVTPMALLLVEAGGTHPVGTLIGDRVLDTLIGVALGLIAAVAVTNRRAAGRVERALAAAADARAAAERTLEGPAPCAAALDADSRRLAAALVDLRDAQDTAAGEWWQRTLPEEEVLEAERAGHRTLAATAQRRGLHGPAPTIGAV
ncbi:FUSC family protein [Streptomyces sp. V1I6]|uniref:FUSC family protein n=1 Tax=Streptomyces sp. V1I6 TaxID=3042273 RepID=UPI00278B5687|nr:FUSC family protein [Streptomyces sp. V1I6]MDQ0846219.1 putative membrane protein YccC [Streptomyces sp. V1I6]